MKQIETIRCPKCRKTIGTLYFENGKIYCHVADIMARTFIHNCAVCGYSYHWHAEEMERQAAKKKPLLIR